MLVRVQPSTLAVDLFVEVAQLAEAGYLDLDYHSRLRNAQMVRSSPEVFAVDARSNRAAPVTDSISRGFIQRIGYAA